MADNIDVTPGVGKTVAADEIAGALHQRVKITVGADGTNDGDVSSANPLPITDSASEALLTTIDADTGAMVTDLAAIEVLLGTIDADTGNIATAIATPSSIGNGAKVVTTAGTAEALAGSIACKKIILCAKDSNTGKIYYGGSGVSATSGAYLYPGASVEINISNLSAVYIDSAVNGEGVQYTYVA